MESTTIHENRRWNFRQLIRSAGGNNAVAALMNVSTSYIVIVAGPTPTRNIGPKMAAKIEARFGLNPGALDVPPPVEAMNTQDHYLSSIAATLANAPDDDKELVLSFSHWVRSRSLAQIAPGVGKLSLNNITNGISDVTDITDPNILVAHNASASGHKFRAKPKGK